MMIISVLFKLLTLISLAATAPVNHIIIGYRCVDEDKAKEYNKAGTLVPFPARGRQIGEGVYLTPGPGQYPRGGDWNCVITARKDKFDAVPKAWVPQHDDCANQLWFADEDEIDGYVKALGVPYKKAIRLSPIMGQADTMQIMLPEKQLNMNGGKLEITARCVEGLGGLPTYVVPWDEWDIEGRPEE